MRDVTHVKSRDGKLLSPKGHFDIYNIVRGSYKIINVTIRLCALYILQW